jgi:hypothetical protein
MSGHVSANERKTPAVLQNHSRRQKTSSPGQDDTNIENFVRTNEISESDSSQGTRELDRNVERNRVWHV